MLTAGPGVQDGDRRTEQGEGSRPGDDPPFRHLHFCGVEHHPLDCRKVVKAERVQHVGGYHDVLIFVLRVGDAHTDPDLR